VSATSTKRYYEDYWARPEIATADDRHAATRLRLLLDLLRRDNGTPRVLDAGAGLGHVVAGLRRQGIDASGMDLSGRAVAEAGNRHPGCRFVEHDVEELPWPVEPYSLDAVVAFEVIEHLLRPRRLLEGASQALKPGGHVALTTPYHGVLKNIVLTLVAFDRHFAVEGDHIRFFSDGALRRLLEETGFAVERTTHFGRIRGLSAGVFVWARKVR
jgi:SAM-dependent methyltransferase